MVLIMVMLISPLFTSVYSQDVRLNIIQTISLEKNGGNLYILYKIDMVNGKENKLVFKFPHSFINSSYYMYIKAYQEKSNPLPVDVKYDDISTSIIIDTTSVVEKEGKYPLTLILYVPAFIYQDSAMQYKVKIVPYPGSNIPINYTKININFPLDTKPDNSPPNTEIIKVSPTGAPQDQYKIEGEFNAVDIDLDENGLPKVYDIVIRPTKTTHPQIILLKGNASLNVEILSNGNVKYWFKYSLLNFGKDPLAGPVYLEFKNIPRSEEVEGVSTLNRSLETTEVGDLVRVALPYITKSGEVVQLRLRYIVSGVSELKGVLGNEVYYNISFNMPSEFFIETLVIRVYGPASNLVYEDTLYNVTKFSRITVTGSVSNNVFMILGQEPVVGVSLFIIALVGISYSVYSFVTYHAVGRLPPELTKYLEKVSKFIDTMNELISLEDLYLSREIKSKEYVAKRNNLLRRLKTELREASESRNILRKIGKDNPVIERELNLIDELMDKWDMLRKLENEFKSRKISPQEYVERRKQLLLEFKTLVSKISI